MGRYHTVQEGDCLSSLAEQNGHFWETLWNAPENESLRNARVDPNALAPGDRVFVPDLRERTVEAATDRRHRFRRRGVPSKLVLRFLFADGRPRADVRYTLTVDGAVTTGRTDGDGYVRATIPGVARQGTIVLHGDAPESVAEDERDDDEHPPDETITLTLGTLAPHGGLAGAQARLYNLGAVKVRVTGRADDETALALKAFQSGHGLEPTGALDDATADALRAAHGS